MPHFIDRAKAGACRRRTMQASGGPGATGAPTTGGRSGLTAGAAEATVWTNDLTHAYVHENSAYST